MAGGIARRWSPTIQTILIGSGPLLDELKHRMPKDERGRKKGRFPQLLTEDVGHPALAQHLHAVTALMTAARNWDDFKRMINISLSRRRAQT